MAQPTAEVREARRRLRRLRASIDRVERIAAECAIVGALERLRLFRRGARVAFYLPMRGEVDVRPAIEAAWRRGAAVYVPRIVSRRRSRMCFVRWMPDGPRRRNVFGIEEPSPGAERVDSRQLDAVVLPVVGFDRDGNRLGMGAGYYDRALRCLRDPGRRWRRPRLIGIAFARQEVDRIAPASWDVPLDHVVTERGIIDARRHLVAG
jgi:5-formyltetrahydrofolate cyclo-ligase